MVRSIRTSTSLQLRRMMADLPDTPGVYIFHGQPGILLYVGKSKTICTRVRAHFAAKEEEHLCAQVHHIEVRRTAGELGALLLESQLIKELRPLYNVMARQKRRIVLARKIIDSSGYSIVSLEAVERIDPSHTSPLMAIFKTRAQAKEYLAAIAKSHRLCPKLLGLERTTRHCFSYHLGLCSGACMGEEPPAGYNARFEAAFAERRVKAWPFHGAVIIEEREENNNAGEVFVVDHWCLLYSFRYDLHTFQLTLRGAHRFDYDSYKILARYIFEERNRPSMREALPTEIESMLAGTWRAQPG